LLAVFISASHLCIDFKREKNIADREVKFNSLIEAGEAIGLYDHIFRGELDWLRDQRNTIHLAKQIEQNNRRRGFEASDRARAKKTTEDLRAKLRTYVLSMRQFSAQRRTRP
jgi:hypothetical protein